LLRLEPLLRPNAQLADRGLERETFQRERVEDADGRPVEHFPLDDAGRLQLAQSRREQPVGDLRYRVRQLAEAVRSRYQRADYCAGPALADELDGRVEVRADG